MASILQVEHCILSSIHRSYVRHSRKLRGYVWCINDTKCKIRDSCSNTGLWRCNVSSRLQVHTKATEDEQVELREDKDKKEAIRRPTQDDVQRLSEGRAAKTRGWGSRQIPHRLNAEERKVYDLAKKKGALTLKGSGYRKERKGSPLANIWRQYNDSTARHCIIVLQSSSGMEDVVLVDISTLRDPFNIDAEMHRVMDVAQRFSLDSHQIPGGDVSPFTVIVPEGIFGDLDDSRSKDDEWIHHALQAPIWQQWPKLVCLQTNRNQGKILAKALVDELL